MMRSMRTLPALTLALTATPVFAQADKVVHADPQRGGWIVLMMAIVLTMCVVAISILSSRREHRD